MTSQDAELFIPEKTQKNWQEIVDILAKLFQVPAGLIMRLTGRDIEVFASSRSPGNPYRRGDREAFEGSGLYCERVIKTRDRLLVPNALADADWKANPDVKRNMIAYLGYPIFLPSGKPFGTICVLDGKRNEFSPVLEQIMWKFKETIESQLELAYANQVLGDKNKRLTDYLMELQALRGCVHICSNCKAIKNIDGKWAPIEHYLMTHPEAEFSHGLCPGCREKLFPDI